jgi:CubicO group peptidase (beta-lactamase class C family)
MLFATLAFGEVVSKHNLYESAITTARSKIWQAINSGKCGSATTAIMVDGKVVYAEGFGMADREKSIPVDKATIFNIGSISKVYVATAIMLLVDDGRVSLDRPVTDYLPEFKMVDDRYKKITVRMLLNHVSGIPGTEGSNSFGFKYDDNI